MKRSLIFAGTLLLAALVCVRAQTKDESKKETYQPGTVLTVDKHVPESTYIGTPTDASLQADDYSYDIGIRVNRMVYVGRYESAIDYIPSSFVRNHQVEVLTHKHILYVRMPELGREVKMGIIGHRRVKNDACRVNS